MSTVTFYPARLRGSASVPPAKSEAHRALLLAALGQNPCRLNGFPPPLCDDVNAMIAGVTALGAKIEQAGEALYVTPAPPPTPGAPMITCHVNACAAALRMLIPAFLVRGQKVRFTMEEGLFKRPMDAYDPLLRLLGGTLERIPAHDGEPCSMILEGTMPAGEYYINGSQSSQFASGLLIALAHARNASGQPAQSFLNITGAIVSRPYLDMTLKLMERFHTGYREREEGAFTIYPRSDLSPESLDISGDWSQAAVFLCANAMGNGIMIKNLLAGQCLQGDARIMNELCRMGMRMVWCHQELYAVCPSHAELSPLEVNCSNIPDVAPILALTCATLRGKSTLTGVRRLTIKECDRLKGTIDVLEKLGVKAESSTDGDTLHVYGTRTLHGGFEADALGDHRMVMLLATAAAVADSPITVHGVEALNKSWPGFIEAYQSLGGKLE
ncbi:MAG: hypothetical protein PHI98_08140 [Eubacteriales bacterium]|nr:hypothetical protein [Eubacteriales bacterium]